jgi:hypothetical protein
VLDLLLFVSHRIPNSTPHIIPITSTKFTLILLSPIMYAQRSTLLVVASWLLVLLAATANAWEYDGWSQGYKHVV